MEYAIFLMTEGMKVHGKMINGLVKVLYINLINSPNATQRPNASPGVAMVAPAHPLLFLLIFAGARRGVRLKSGFLRKGGPPGVARGRPPGRRSQRRGDRHRHCRPVVAT